MLSVDTHSYYCCFYKVGYSVQNIHNLLEWLQNGMNHTKPIYTEKNDCQDCYKCVRECPVKAIKIEDGSASIIEDLCIFCGHCTEICPVGAKKIRNDLSLAKLFLGHGDTVVASIAPSWVADFPGVTEAQLVAALKFLGFKAISETSIGAEVVSAETGRLLKDAGWNKRVAISTACPAVVEIIAKYHPEYVPFLTPVISPMLVHVGCKRSRCRSL